MLHLAVDVGGTFTDICLFDDQEKISTFELIRRYGVILDWGPGSYC